MCYMTPGSFTIHEPPDNKRPCENQQNARQNELAHKSSQPPPRMSLPITVTFFLLAGVIPKWIIIF